jgi:hypothetical protein
MTEITMMAKHRAIRTFIFSATRTSKDKKYLENFSWKNLREEITQEI